jgi:hypothetical protein
MINARHDCVYSVFNRLILMTKLMLDSMIFDKLILDAELIRHLKILIENNKIFLYWTHIQEEQIFRDETPSEKKIAFRNLLDKLNIKKLERTVSGWFIEKDEDVSINTFPFVFNDDPKSYDVVRGASKKYKIALDAAIAQTAADFKLDYILSEDGDFNRNKNPPAINYEDFKKLITNTFPQVKLKR